MAKRTGKVRSLDYSSEQRAVRPRTWLVLITVGVALRIVLAVISIGTNDAAAWLRFGDEINQHGLLNTYKTDPDFNHPPIPGYWAAFCAKLAGDGDWKYHDSVFTILFKVAPILGDCLGIYLLFLVWRAKRDRSFGLFVAAMFALSLDAVVVSGYHCNTDSLLIALCLLSLFLLEDRSKPGLAGLALGAAINVKLIPVLLIPAMVLGAGSAKKAAYFVAGLGVGVLPFVPALLKVSTSFFNNALRYNSMVDRWGMNYFFLLGEETWNPSSHGAQLSTAYYAKARYIILGLIGLWAVLSRIKPRWTLYEIALVSFAIFLLFAPGFGVQYTVLVGLPLFAVRPRWGVGYSVVAGLFVTSAYYMYWKGAFPLYSHWGVLFPEPVGVLGLVTWLLLIVIVVVVLVRPVSLARPMTARHNPAGR
jgi:glycosyl transferase family 87